MGVRVFTCVMCACLDVSCNMKRHPTTVSNNNNLSNRNLRSISLDHTIQYHTKIPTVMHNM